MDKARFFRSTHGLEGVPYVFGISIDSVKSTGQPFEAAVECVNDAGLRGGLVVVSDTLKRYGLVARGLTPENAYRASLESGEAWLDKNARTLEHLEGAPRIVRWDEWIHGAEYDALSSQFAKAANQNDKLRGAIRYDAYKFHGRTGQGPCGKDLRLSYEFLLEELAAITLQLRAAPMGAVQLYIGKQLACLKALRAGEVKQAPPTIAQSQFYGINVYEDVGL